MVICVYRAVVVALGIFVLCVVTDQVLGGKALF